MVTQDRMFMLYGESDRHREGEPRGKLFISPAVHPSVCAARIFEGITRAQVSSWRNLFFGNVPEAVFQKRTKSDRGFHGKRITA